MSEILQQLLENDPFPLTQSAQSKVMAFYRLLLKENGSQNLTRLFSPSDFYFGHLQDVRELLKTGWVKYPALDLGSGAGIPGLLSALVEEGVWILAESEVRKAEYLKHAVQFLALDLDVSVYSGRAEEFLLQKKVSSIVIRAVGSISRIYSWLRRSSTWNDLILLKGPKWDSEWEEFNQTKFRKELILKSIHAYTVGPENKIRKIILLTRSCLNK